MKKQRIKINENQLKKIVKESVKKVLNENQEQFVRFNWNITVSEKYAAKMYKLQSQLENAKWVEDFERDEKIVDMQQLSINPMSESRINESPYDSPHVDTVERYRETDPEELSDSELEQAIDYMLAYRWALRGREGVLDRYLQEYTSRGLK